jgi:hypothetical protein
MPIINSTMHGSTLVFWKIHATSSFKEKLHNIVMSTPNCMIDWWILIDWLIQEILVKFQHLLDLWDITINNEFLEFWDLGVEDLSACVFVGSVQVNAAFVVQGYLRFENLRFEAWANCEKIFQLLGWNINNGWYCTLVHILLR